MRGGGSGCVLDGQFCHGKHRLVDTCRARRLPLHGPGVQGRPSEAVYHGLIETAVMGGFCCLQRFHRVIT
jgi:hypothetical protein